MKLVLTGGFLGSGKTTAIIAAARLMVRAGKSVAVITNDQGDQQVDSAIIKTEGLPMREVSGACFCCKYEALTEHLQSLKENDPDVIFAESVGSCTDLIATVVKPLHHFNPEIETVISIFADAELLASVIAGKSSFIDESVRYIYKKQLQEADLLILNKVDLLTNQEINEIKLILESEYPGKVILQQNSLRETDIAVWLDCMDKFRFVDERDVLDIDYAQYGKGESHLAWLDKKITIHTDNGEAMRVSQKIIVAIADLIQQMHLPIGHLKFFIETATRKEKISFTNTRGNTDFMIAPEETNCAELLINARVETEPAALKNLVDEVLSLTTRTYHCRIESGKWAVFKPGYPRPTHRMLQ